MLTVSHSFEYRCIPADVEDLTEINVISHMYVRDTQMTKFHVKLVIKAITNWLYLLFLFLNLGIVTLHTLLRQR